MFFIVGLGLSDEKDVTLRGLEVGQRPDTPTHRDNSPPPQAIQNASRVYLEAYTSILMVQKERLVTYLITPLSHLLTFQKGSCLR